MVKENYYTIYICPYCNSNYKNVYAAEYCAEDCADIEEPIEKEITFFQCEYCDKKFKSMRDANLCEQNHKKNKDIYFQDYEDKKEREKLNKAASLKGQTRLG